MDKNMVFYRSENVEIFYVPPQDLQKTPKKYYCCWIDEYQDLCMDIIFNVFQFTDGNIHKQSLKWAGDCRIISEVYLMFVLDWVNILIYLFVLIINNLGVMVEIYLRHLLLVCSYMYLKFSFRVWLRVTDSYLFGWKDQYYHTNFKDLSQLMW